MRWNLVLFGCFYSRGLEYDFDVLGRADIPLATALRAAALTSPCAFFGSFEGRLFFGRRDLVGKALGPDHEVARDASRPLEYMLLYTAPRGTALPSWAELRGLDTRIVEDLRHYGEACMKARRPTEEDVAIDLPPFAGAAAAGGAAGWDRAAAEAVAAGDRLFVADEQGLGAFRELRRPAPPRGKSGSAAPTHDQEIAALVRQKHGGSWTAPLMLGGAGLAIGTLLLLAFCVRDEGPDSKENVLNSANLSE
jgi:hypothetical protein